MCHLIFSLSSYLKYRSFYIFLNSISFFSPSRWILISVAQSASSPFCFLIAASANFLKYRSGLLEIPQWLPEKTVRTVSPAPHKCLAALHTCLQGQVQISFHFRKSLAHGREFMASGRIWDIIFDLDFNIYSTPGSSFLRLENTMAAFQVLLIICFMIHIIRWVYCKYVLG